MRNRDRIQADVDELFDTIISENNESMSERNDKFTDREIMSNALSLIVEILLDIRDLADQRIVNRHYD